MQSPSSTEADSATFPMKPSSLLDHHKRTTGQVSVVQGEMRVIRSLLVERGQVQAIWTVPR